MWVSSNGFAQIFGGLVAYSIAHSKRLRESTITSWKVIFLLFGCLTIFIGCLVLVFMPDSQLNAWWLSPNDRVLAVQRVRVNQQGIGNTKFKFYQFKEVFTDPLSWGVFLFAVAANIPNGGLVNFFSQLIVAFGFTPEQSLLYGTPAGAFGILILALWAIISHSCRCRMICGMVAMAVALLGVVLIVSLPSEQRLGRLVGYYMTMAIPAGEASILSHISSNVAG